MCIISIKNVRVCHWLGTPRGYPPLHPIPPSNCWSNATCPFPSAQGARVGRGIHPCGTITRLAPSAEPPLAASTLCWRSPALQRILVGSGHCCCNKQNKWELMSKQTKQNRQTKQVGADVEKQQRAPKPTKIRENQELAFPIQNLPSKMVFRSKWRCTTQS